MKKCTHCTQNSVPLVYAPGIPELFHRNYRLLEDMLQQLEVHGCKSTESVRRFREGDGMRSLRKRWNMSIYYSIRHRAIVQEIQSHMTDRPRPVDEGEASRTDCSWHLFRAVDCSLRPVQASYSTKLMPLAWLCKSALTRRSSWIGLRHPCLSSRCNCFGASASG